MSPAVIRFDQALRNAIQVVRSRLGPSLTRVVVARDLLGKIRIALDDRGTGLSLDKQDFRRLGSDLAAVLGAFGPDPAHAFLVASDMVAPEEIFGSADVQLPIDGVRILDQTLIGADWLRPRFEEVTHAGRVPPNRVALYGVKGGVGRSTATAVLARELARVGETGKRIMVIDLDLESPGVGTTLLPGEQAPHMVGTTLFPGFQPPEYGICDWFVEDGVGQADDVLLADMVVASPLADKGEILVVPAGGRVRSDYEYLPKLNRVYLTCSAGSEEQDFAARLHRLVLTLEARYQPDLTLLDSRAGLHDIAAVTVTRLGALSLLFAVDTAQTWATYRWLFQSWNRHQERARAFRGDLKMVAAQVPETDSEAYLARFRARSHELFQEFLYSEVPPGEMGEFNFEAEDDQAPHHPLRINWSRALQQYDPVQRPGAITDAQVNAGFGDLVAGVRRLVFPEDAP
jgi:hypothetical protein